MMKIAFWLSLAVIIYVYAGLPLLAGIVGKLRNRRVQKRPITPKISLIIAAYNEEDNIGEKLENVLALDYPSEDLEIIVASDGSNDATVSIVASYEDRGVRLLNLPRRGKIHALNDAVIHAAGEILVFSDANSIFEKQALRKLASNFADPEVGGVSGYLKYTESVDSDASGQGEHLYWSYEAWLKRMESLTGSIISANGAIYAIRRELYRSPAATAVTDDFAISTAVIEQGYRLVFDSEARCYEQPAPAASGEFGRKVRIMNRGLRGVILRKNLLNPFKYDFYSVVLFSQKILRRLVPFLLFILFVSSFLLSPQGSFHFWTFVTQILFYILACIGYLIRNTRLGQLKCFYIPFYYCLANAAALVAIINLIGGKRIEQWQPQR